VVIVCPSSSLASHLCACHSFLWGFEWRFRFCLQSSFLLFLKLAKGVHCCCGILKAKSSSFSWCFAVLFFLRHVFCSCCSGNCGAARRLREAVGATDAFAVGGGWAVPVHWCKLLCFSFVNVVVFNFAGISAGPNRSVLLLGLLGTDSICWCNQRHGAGKVAVFLKARSPLAQENDTKLRTLLGEASNSPGCDSPGTY